ncbi:hypothetical protein STSO111631_18035 [Stackebrandtia soli]
MVASVRTGHTSAWWGDVRNRKTNRSQEERPTKPGNASRHDPGGLLPSAQRSSLAAWWVSVTDRAESRSHIHRPTKPKVPARRVWMKRQCPEGAIRLRVGGFGTSGFGTNGPPATPARLRLGGATYETARRTARRKRDPPSRDTQAGTTPKGSSCLRRGRASRLGGSPLPTEQKAVVTYTAPPSRKFPRRQCPQGRHSSTRGRVWKEKTVPGGLLLSLQRSSLAAWWGDVRNRKTNRSQEERPTKPGNESRHDTGRAPPVCAEVGSCGLVGLRYRPSRKPQSHTPPHQAESSHVGG